jgi:hypothetical protein
MRDPTIVGVARSWGGEHEEWSKFHDTTQTTESPISCYRFSDEHAKYLPLRIRLRAPTAPTHFLGGSDRQIIIRGASFVRIFDWNTPWSGRRQEINDLTRTPCMHNLSCVERNLHYNSLSWFYYILKFQNENSHYNSLHYNISVFFITL